MHQQDAEVEQQDLLHGAERHDDTDSQDGDKPRTRAPEQRASALRKCPTPPGWRDAVAPLLAADTYFDAASESRNAWACFLCSACALTLAQPAISAHVWPAWRSRPTW